MIARPDHPTVRPNPTVAVSMDPLSDVLSAVRLTGSLFFSGLFTAPWCVGVKITPDECARHLPGLPAQIIGYHVVVEGRMLVGVNSDPPVEVSAGEIVVFRRMPARSGRPARSLTDQRERTHSAVPGRRLSNGPRRRRRRDSDRVRISREPGPLQSALPDFAQGAQDRRARAASRERIEASVRFAANDLAEGRIASSSVIARLSALLFTETGRQYASTSSKRKSLRKGVKDPHIGRARALFITSSARPGRRKGSE